MDFESYIGRERQLITKLDKERTDNNSYERRAEIGNYDLAEDEIRLLKSGDYVMDKAGLAREAIAVLEERLAELQRVEASINARSAEFNRRVTEWEAGFDRRTREIVNRIDGQIETLELRNASLLATIDAARKNISQAGEASDEEIRKVAKATTGEVRKTSDATMATVKTASEKAAKDIEQLLAELKTTQAEFDSSVSEKLKQDKETVERIRYMMKMMSEMVKI